MNGTGHAEAGPAILSPFYLAGPTASGKSALAIALAQHWNGEIINADAFQLYQNLEIVTAQPSAAEKRLVPHHLYGVLPVAETSNAARYAALARQAIAEVQARGRRPIVVGGSGLYLKALTHGLTPLPPVNPALREEIARLSSEERIAKLLELDAEGAATINLRNDRYVSRALELCLLTGRPASELKQAWATEAPPSFTGIVLQWPREQLVARIEKRAASMIGRGLLQEIRDLPPLSPTAEKAIGIREMQAHLRGELTLDQALERMTIATRQYAKRQITWFKREVGFQILEMSESFDPETWLSHLPSA